MTTPAKMSNPSSTQQNRQALRNHFRQLRHNLSVSQQKNASYALAKNLSTTAAFIRAKNIAVYWPSDGEISLLPTIQQAFARKKNIFLPVITLNNKMHFSSFSKTSKLTVGRWGILQPKPSAKAVKPFTLDLLLTPMVAFDLEGNRLGRGGGFYDRYLGEVRQSSYGKIKASNKPSIIGVAHQCQQSHKIPVEVWDIPVDAVVTDSRTSNFRLP